MIENCPYKHNCNGKDCQKDFCLRKYKLDFLYNNSLLSEAQRKHITLLTDNDGTDYNEFVKLAEISKNIEEFVSSGKNLYLHSTTSGNGKSSWAIRMIESYFYKAWAKVDLSCKALFVSVPRFLLALKNNISKRDEYAEFITQNILTADLVVWDDIAAKTATEFELNQLLSIIEGRISLGKSNIFTSNLSKEAMYEALGSRVASRICNLSIDIELHGKDKRQLKEQEEGGNR